MPVAAAAPAPPRAPVRRRRPKPQPTAAYFTAQAGRLTEALKFVARAAARRTVHPIIQGVLVTAADDVCTLRGTDLDTTCEATLPVACALERVDLVASPGLLQLLADMPADAQVTIAAEDGKVRVVCAAPLLDVSLPSLPASEFPTRPPDTTETLLTLTLGELQELARHVTPFASDEGELRTSFVKIIFRRSKGKVSAFGTNGHHAGRATILKDVTPAPPIGVHRRALAVAIALPLKESDTINIQECGSHLGIGNDTARVWYKADNSKTSDIDQSSGLTKAETYPELGIVSREGLLGAISHVGRISGDDRAVTLAFEEGLLEVSTEHQGRGEGVEVLRLERGDRPFEVRCNGTYLATFLNLCDSDKVTYSADDPLGALVCRPGEPPAGLASFIQILMPLRM